jgi:hypothetical protein
MNTFIGIILAGITSVHADTMTIPPFEGTIYNYSKIANPKLVLNWNCRKQVGNGLSSCGTDELIAKVKDTGKIIKYQFDGIKNREIDPTSNHFVTLSLVSNDQKIFLWEGFVGQNDFRAKDLISKNNQISLYLFKKKKLKFKVTDGTNFMQWLGDHSPKEIRYEANVTIPGQPTILNISKFFSDNPARLQYGAYVDPENFNLETKLFIAKGDMGEVPYFHTNVSLVRLNGNICIGVCDAFLTKKSIAPYNGEYPLGLDLLVE